MVPKLSQPAIEIAQCDTKSGILREGEIPGMDEQVASGHVQFAVKLVCVADANDFHALARQSLLREHDAI
jgi:hypothetical protein